MQRELSFNTPYQLSLRMHLQYAGSTLRYRMCVATFDASLDIDVGDSVRRSGFDSLGSTHHPSILGSSPNSGERSADFEEEVFVITEAVGHPLDDFDLVVDALEHAGVQRIAAVRQQPWQVAA